MDAEDVMDISDAFNVTAVPFLVLRRGDQVLETVSGSDATKVRTAIEKHANTPSVGVSSHGAASAATATTSGVKNLSNYAPTAQDPATAPQYSSGESKESKEELHKRLSTLVKAAPVMLFMKGTPSAPQCGFSRQTVAILRENSVKYGFFNILADDEVRQGLKEFADWPTFPQLWVDGELVGGLDIVRSIPHPVFFQILNYSHLLQIKEEISNDPDFFKAYSVPKTGATQQGTSATVTA